MTNVILLGFLIHMFNKMLFCVSTFGLIFKLFISKKKRHFNDYQQHYFCIRDVKNVCICFVQGVSHSSPQRGSAFCFLAGNRTWFVQLSELMNKLTVHIAGILVQELKSSLKKTD